MINGLHLRGILKAGSCRGQGGGSFLLKHMKDRGMSVVELGGVVVCLSCSGSSRECNTRIRKEDSSERLDQNNMEYETIEEDNEWRKHYS